MSKVVEQQTVEQQVEKRTITAIVYVEYDSRAFPSIGPGQAVPHVVQLEIEKDQPVKAAHFFDAWLEKANNNQKKHGRIIGLNYEYLIPFVPKTEIEETEGEAPIEG